MKDGQKKGIWATFREHWKAASKEDSFASGMGSGVAPGPYTVITAIQRTARDVKMKH
jgi:hypothetical protein